MLTGLSLRANEKRGMRESRDDSFKETCCKAEQRNQMYVGEGSGDQKVYLFLF